MLQCHHDSIQCTKRQLFLCCVRLCHYYLIPEFRVLLRSKRPCLLCSYITQCLDRIWAEWDNFETNCRSKLTLVLGYDFTKWPSWVQVHHWQKGEAVVIFLLTPLFSILSPLSPPYLCPQPPAFPLDSFTMAYLISNETASSCPFLPSDWAGVACCVTDWLTQVPESPESEQWEDMARSRSDGDIQEWSWTCSFSMSQAIP